MLYRQLIRRRDGATVLEFALIAPALLLSLIGFIEMGMILYADTLLEGATNLGARLGKVGSTEAIIRSRIQDLSGGFLDAGKLQFSFQAYPTFDSIGNGNPCPPAPAPCPYTAGLGTSGQVVLYRVTYPWTILTPVVNSLISLANPSADGLPATINLTAVATIRNE